MYDGRHVVKFSSVSSRTHS